MLILLFVAYLLWGTGIHEARSQDKLEDEFSALLQEHGTPSTTETSRRPSPTTTALPPPPPQLEGGGAVARIVIPKLGVDKIVVQGVTLADLKRGPGHYPDTPLPGQKGNAAIAGHRTTYGAPFHRLDELVPGDEIITTTLQGRFHYKVIRQLVVQPSQVEVLDATDVPRLTLTTCNPKYSARERLVIRAGLVEKPKPAPKPRPEKRDPGGPAVDPAGLSGHGASNWPAILWGAGAFLVGLVLWLVGHRRRFAIRWLIYLGGAPVFLVVLFFFFENFSRLLPSNF